MNLASSGIRQGHVKEGHAKGFTLIELLVVIAIIGILSAVVLASLSTARSKGKDASVQESMSGMRTAMEIYYGGTGSNKYSTTGLAITSCGAASSGFSDTPSNMAGLLTAVNAALGNATGAYTNMVCDISATGDAWLVSSKLPSAPAANGFFCVDSTGTAKVENATAPANALTCA
jgi:prepilin-type N-terminal cleavage/methylation domain-containing protein